MRFQDDGIDEGTDFDAAADLDAAAGLDAAGDLHAEISLDAMAHPDAEPDGILDVFDEDDPEPDVLPGAGWIAHDLSLDRPSPAELPMEAPHRILARAVAVVLATWRLDRGLRQREVARRLGISQPQLSRLERGRGTVSFELLHRVAGMTGTSLSITVSAQRGGRPVRRLVHDAWLSGARTHLVVDGPAGRNDVAPPRASGGRARGTIS